MLRRKKLISLLPALTVIVLTLLQTACATTSPEYIYDVPAVVFPVFPDPDCVTFDEESGLVSFPLWYWEEIAKYKISVNAIEAYLARLRAADTLLEEK
ncbi:MAG: hypothetical protein LBU99_01625 [Spirochaetaceae bacterium]|jgi:hypothetical protein|nr:hypothetical protein [Spirochaetaceae bacterium]